MPYTFAIADLHGRFDLLQRAYAEILVAVGGVPSTIVHLGDYVDRGPQSRQIIEFLMDEGTVPAGWRRVVLRGNHEQILQIVCRRPHKMHWWLSNGGGPTLMSYGQNDGDIADANVVPPAHLEWIASLPLMHEDEHRVYVHAGLEDGVPLSKQDSECLIWKLYKDGEPAGGGNLHVVHGHHQHEDGPKLFADRTNLDTGAYYSGRLVVGVFDDDVPGGAVDFIVLNDATKPSQLAAAS